MALTAMRTLIAWLPLDVEYQGSYAEHFDLTAPDDCLQAQQTTNNGTTRSERRRKPLRLRNAQQFIPRNSCIQTRIENNQNLTTICDPYSSKSSRLIHGDGANPQSVSDARIEPPSHAACNRSLAGASTTFIGEFGASSARSRLKRSENPRINVAPPAKGPYREREIRQASQAVKASALTRMDCDTNFSSNLRNFVHGVP